MKSFARLFFFIGSVLSVYLFLFPEGLRFVSIPGSPAPIATSELSERPVASIVETVELVVNGVPYQFKLASLEVEYVHSQAKAFCLTYQEALSLTAERIEAGCTQVVVNNIFNKIKEKRAAASPVPSPVAEPAQSAKDNSASTVYQVNVPVTNGKTYTVSFDAAVHSPFQVSEHFCRENQIELGLESENQIVQGCVPSVGRYIAEQLESVGFVRPNSAAPEVPRAEQAVEQSAGPQ